MDLNKYLKEPAKLSPDLGWWIDAETFDVEGNHRNPHECKDELALQWGNEGFMVETDDKIVPVKKENKKASIQADIIQITRSLMNSGMKTANIREYLAKHQNPNVIKACSQEIDRQLRLEGSVGRFVLDARGYKNCSDALRTVEKNPFKRHLKYMIGCTCSNHIKTKDFTSGMMLSNGDPFGDVINDQTRTDVSTTNSCPKTGMRILSGQGDLDEEWAGDTMIDVLNASGLDKVGAKSLTASDEQPYMRLKKFFIALDNGNFSKEEIAPLDMSANQETDLGQAAISFKLDDLNPISVNVNDDSGSTIKLNPDMSTDKLDVDVGSMNFGLNRDVKKEDDIDVDIESMCFGLDNGADNTPINDMSVGSDMTINGFDMDFEKPIQTVSIAPELKIDRFDDDTETIPFDIPAPETNTFSLDNTENKDISVNNCQSPVEIEVVPVDVISDIEFGTPEEDDLYCDGMIKLDDEETKDPGMIFSF